MNEWFRSYLSRRTQFVSVGRSCSPLTNVALGVPQGSKLGPLLFLLYINDMSKVSNMLSFVPFADDTTIFVTGKSIHNLVDLVNREIVKVDEWLCVNRLSEC